MVFDTSEYGVPQTRKRVFVIGVKKKYSKLIPKIYEDLINVQKDKNKYTVKDAISDLTPLKPGEGTDKVKLIKK